jgi:hypothetical protein
VSLEAFLANLGQQGQGQGHERTLAESAARRAGRAAAGGRLPGGGSGGGGGGGGGSGGERGRGASARAIEALAAQSGHEVPAQRGEGKGAVRG